MTCDNALYYRCSLVCCWLASTLAPSKLIALLEQLEGALLNRKDIKVPEGMAFIDLIFGLADKCFSTTRESCMQLGDLAPACLTNLGTLLSLMDRLASCWWKCNEGDHIIEYLTGRGVSSARASLRLAFDGFYDESLSLTRSIGEIANLFSLFVADPPSLSSWKSASKQERLKKFGPAAVRRRLKELGAPLPISDERYSILCEAATHVTPATLPQGNNPLLMPTLGGKFQETGYLASLNELSVAIIFVAIFSVLLIKPSKEISDRVREVGMQTAESIGGVNVIDGFPRLTNEAIAELQSLGKELSPDEQRHFQSALFVAVNNTSHRTRQSR